MPGIDVLLCLHVSRLWTLVSSLMGDIESIASEKCNRPTCHVGLCHLSHGVNASFSGLITPESASASADILW